jgi:hypothetical protein
VSQQPGTSVYTSDLDTEAVRRALAEADPERPFSTAPSHMSDRMLSALVRAFRKGDGAARGRAVPSARSPPTVVERGLPTTPFLASGADSASAHIDPNTANLSPTWLLEGPKSLVASCLFLLGMIGRCPRLCGICHQCSQAAVAVGRFRGSRRPPVR